MSDEQPNEQPEELTQEEKKPTPICPLTSSPSSNIYCRYQQCAWFHNDTNCCSMLALADSLGSIETYGLQIEIDE